MPSRPKKNESVGVEIEKRKKVARVIFKGKAPLLTAAQTAFIIRESKSDNSDHEPTTSFLPFRNFLLRQIIVPHCHCFNSYSSSHPFPFVYNANPVCVIINVYHKSHLGGCKWMWQPITKAEPISAVHFFSFSSFHYLMTKF